MELFYASGHGKGTVRYLRISVGEEAVLCTVKDSPSTNSKAVGIKLGVNSFPA